MSVRKTLEKTNNVELVVSLVIVMATILGATIPLYIYTSSQSHSQIEAIREEIKDFHCKLYELEKRRK